MSAIMDSTKEKCYCKFFICVHNYCSCVPIDLLWKKNTMFVYVYCGIEVHYYIIHRELDIKINVIL